MSDNRSSSGGIGFCGMLTILFIALKLLEKIDWSWEWVLSPLWIPVAALISVGVVVGIAYLILLGIASILRSWKDSKAEAERLEHQKAHQKALDEKVAAIPLEQRPKSVFERRNEKLL